MSASNQEDSDTSDEEYVPDEPIHDSPQHVPVENEEPVQIYTEDKKSESDKLWADFLSDIPKSSHPVKTASSEAKGEGISKPESNKKKNLPSKVKVTQVFDFAGEEVKVTKEIDADSKLAKKLSKEDNKTENLITPSASKRLSSGGLGGILNQLSKKPKMSVFDKSRMDWNTFRSENELEDSLDQFRKSKGSYVERKAFLNRAELREFEKERDVRLGSKKNL